MHENQVVEYVNKKFREYFSKLPRLPKTDKQNDNVLYSVQLHSGLRITRFSIEEFHDIKDYKNFLDEIAQTFAVDSYYTLVKSYGAIQKPFKYHEDEIPKILLDKEDETDMISLDVSNLIFCT